MSPADRRLLKDLAGRPLFRCSGGWKRGSTKITLKRASELVALGAFRRATSKAGAPMLVPAQDAGARKPAEPQVEAPQRAWWVD